MQSMPKLYMTILIRGNVAFALTVPLSRAQSRSHGEEILHFEVRHSVQPRVCCKLTIYSRILRSVRSARLPPWNSKQPSLTSPSSLEPQDQVSANSKPPLSPHHASTFSEASCISHPRAFEGRIAQGHAARKRCTHQILPLIGLYPLPLTTP